MAPFERIFFCGRVLLNLASRKSCLTYFWPREVSSPLSCWLVPIDIHLGLFFDMDQRGLPPRAWKAGPHNTRRSFLQERTKFGPSFIAHGGLDQDWVRLLIMSRLYCRDLLIQKECEYTREVPIKCSSIIFEVFTFAAFLNFLAKSHKNELSEDGYFWFYYLACSCDLLIKHPN